MHRRLTYTEIIRKQGPQLAADARVLPQPFWPLTPAPKYYSWQFDVQAEMLTDFYDNLWISYITREEKYRG